MPDFSTYPTVLCTGAILAGGSSSRMGTAKDQLVLPGGKPMLEHIEIQLLRLFRQVIVVGKDYLPDLHPGCGPLGGLEALLSSKVDQAYIAAACDQPLVSADLLRRLHDGDPDRVHIFRAEDPDRFYPFPAYYPSTLLPLVSEMISLRQYSLRALIARTDPVSIPVSPAEEQQLYNVNTPQQFTELNRMLDAAP